MKLEEHQVHVIKMHMAQLLIFMQEALNHLIFKKISTNSTFSWLTLEKPILHTCNNQSIIFYAYL